jgi:hypothetical protein
VLPPPPPPAITRYSTVPILPRFVTIKVPEELNVCTLKLPSVVIVPPVASIKGFPPAPKPNPIADAAPNVESNGILTPYAN